MVWRRILGAILLALLGGGAGAQQFVMQPTIAAEPVPVSETYPNGDRFIGQRLLGQREGRGVYYYANGDRYDGEYHSGRATGVGTFYAANGARYEGEFVDGHFEGQGTLTLPDGSQLVGRWQNDELIDR